MDLLKERIDLGEGDYALVVKELLHKTVKALNAYHRPFTDSQGNVDQSKLDEDEELILIAKIQVMEWSFGPVELASLESIPERKIKALKEAMLKLYAPLAPKPCEMPGGS
jgi:hypothetical protein